eukprot:640120-Rhodomonas_salina.2
MRAGLQATEGVLTKVDKALKESFTLGRGKAREEKARIAKVRVPVGVSATVSSRHILSQVLRDLVRRVCVVLQRCCRVCTGPRAPGGMHSGGGCAGHESRSLRRGRGGARAVSYTHLRAHETEADL